MLILVDNARCASTIPSNKFNKNIEKHSNSYSYFQHIIISLNKENRHTTVMMEMW
ncbi:MAG: hypothetical protein IKG14_03080 [Clostridia bacterium]|nr:hypothetical protein [Clostridia bacterium]